MWSPRVAQARIGIPVSRLGSNAFAPACGPLAAIGIYGVAAS
jgi:hypothetical protein